jgi:para-nitrobenzyl esterase
MKKKSLIIVCAFILGIHCYAQDGPIKAGEKIAVTSTIYGKIRGYIDDGVYVFKGIPYAKADRFMPPQAPDRWDDLQQCTIYGPQAMQQKAQNWEGQGDYNFGFQFEKEAMDEKECLVLNVWSQGTDDEKKRPVWVWIHGGGYSAGSANQLPFFDGRSLAAKGDIVVVTVNHRLNTLGYLDLRGLGDEYSESVNLGMQDLVAALKWINDNIENFGGDPNSVTINGQSGGGGKVSVLTAMPSAAGLFQRAIVQSGMATIPDDKDSKAFGLAFAAALGVNPRNAERLNAFTYEELVNAERQAAGILRASGSNIRGGAGPVIDGKYITHSPFDEPLPQFSKNVAMLIGSDLNEFTYANHAIIKPQTMEQVKETLIRRFGEENAEKYISLYKKAYPDDKEPQHMLTFDTMFRNGASNWPKQGVVALMHLYICICFHGNHR